MRGSASQRFMVLNASIANGVPHKSQSTLVACPQRIDKNAESMLWKEGKNTLECFESLMLLRTLSGSVRNSPVSYFSRETCCHIHVSSGPLCSRWIMPSQPFCHGNALKSKSLTQHMLRRGCPGLAVGTAWHKED